MPVLPAVPSTTVPPGLILGLAVSAAKSYMAIGDPHSLCFSILDESKGGAIFHAATRVLEL
jgi:hypothetical protein